jgi:hypothetical protein
LIINCTIVGNTSGNSGGGIGGSITGTLTVQNSILWNNSVTNVVNQDAQIKMSPGTIIVSNTTIRALGNLAGNGNSSNSPLFIADLLVGSAPSLAGDFHLKSCSPAVNAGANVALGVSTDLDGAPRIFGGLVDMGAYEFQSAATAPLVFTTQPVSLSFCNTGSNQFNVAASGGASYQWEVDRNDGNGFTTVSNNTIYSGATSATLTLNSASSSFNGYLFRCIATSASGCSANSSVAMLTVVSPRRYVNASAAPGGDGTSWATAFNSIVTGVGSLTSGCNNEIWVAGGTYNLGSAGVTMQMRNGVAIYGGFAGTETNLSQRNWVANETIITGELGVPGDLSDNSVTLFNNPDGFGASTLNSSARLDGFILERALTAIWNGQDNAPMIENCVFRQNRRGFESSY